jgi:response regulator RpfG family c-di-GMP phosphodiesterase
LISPTKARLPVVRDPWGRPVWLLLRSSSVLYATAVNAPRILHVSSRELIQKLRDDILRIQGFEVESTLSLSEALEIVQKTKYNLVLIDVEGENRVAGAELLCDEIKKAIPDQRVAYVCNHRVSFNSDCPDEIIRAEFNPELLVRSVREIIADS